MRALRPEGFYLTAIRFDSIVRSMERKRNGAWSGWGSQLGLRAAAYKSFPSASKLRYRLRIQKPKNGFIA